MAVHLFKLSAIFHEKYERTLFLISLRIFSRDLSVHSERGAVNPLVF